MLPIQIDKLAERNYIQLGIKPGSLTSQVNTLPLDHGLNLPSAHQSMLFSQELSLPQLKIFLDES